MRSYGQFCALAQGLDVVGDRWTLLIVRELMVQGSARYTDIKAGLPGIASNLLAERLRWLQDKAIVVSAAAVPPVATPLFTLTARGRALEPVLAAIGRWGAPLLDDAADGSFQTHWLVLPLQLELSDHLPEERPVTVEVRTGDERLAVHAAHGVVTTVTGGAANPDAVISGPPQLVVRLLLGGQPLTEVCDAGLEFTGDPAILQRIRPGNPSPV